MATGEQDKWGEDEWQGISYRKNGEYNVETESPEGNALDRNSGSRSQQATGAFFDVCVPSLNETHFSDTLYPTSPKEQGK